MDEGWALDFPLVQVKRSAVPFHFECDDRDPPLVPTWVDYYADYRYRPRWYEWEEGLGELLQLLSEKYQGRIKPVDSSLQELKRLVAAGSDGATALPSAVH